MSTFFVKLLICFTAVCLLAAGVSAQVGISNKPTVYHEAKVLKVTKDEMKAVMVTEGNVDDTLYFVTYTIKWDESMVEVYDYSPESHKPDRIKKVGDTIKFSIVETGSKSTKDQNFTTVSFLAFRDYRE